MSNHGLHTRSLLVRHAEQYSHKPRPVEAKEIIMAEPNRRERNREISGKAAALCAFVVVAYLVAAFFQQAFQQVMK